MYEYDQNQSLARRHFRAIIAGALAAWISAGCASTKPAPARLTAGAAPTAPAAPVAVPPAPQAQPSLGPPVLLVDEQWTSLFDGRTLEGWKPTPFAGAGEVEVKDGRIVASMGAALTGVNFTNQIPKVNYEVELDAMKVDGSDFFCGLTVPVKDSFCTFIVGGWGGGVVGISSVDGNDASMNETTKFGDFERGRWYHIRMRVTEKRIEAWIDNDKMVDLDTTGRKISMRYGEIELSEPFGLATWITTGAWKNIRLRAVKPE
jgi:hypothetical protein